MGLKLFKATFGHWIDLNDPDIQILASEAEITEEMSKELNFLIEANHSPDAFALARKYEGLETHLHEGIGELILITPINAEEAKSLTPIAIYDEYLARQKEV